MGGAWGPAARPRRDWGPPRGLSTIPASSPSISPRSNGAPSGSATASRPTASNRRRSPSRSPSSATGDAPVFVYRATRRAGHGQERSTTPGADDETWRTTSPGGGRAALHRARNPEAVRLVRRARARGHGRILRAAGPAPRQAPRDGGGYR